MTFASFAGRCRRTILIFSGTSSAVVDASAFVDAVLYPQFSAIFELELHAPVTIDAEVLHSLRRQWLIRRVDDEEVAGAFEILRTAIIRRHPVQSFVPRMWAMRQNVTAYDAGYVALAESLDLPLLTRDGRLARSSGHAARIEFIA